VWDAGNCPAVQRFRIVISASALRTDFLRISEAVAYEPIVFVDISVPLPDHTEWLIPEDADVLINRQSSGMIELMFMRADDFEIGLKARMGNCESSLYKLVTIREKAADENSGGRVAEPAEESLVVTVYPNPMSEQLTIQVSAPGREAIGLQLISGGDNRRVAYEKLEGQHDYLVRWNIPQLTAGVYHLIYEYNNKLYAKRIVVIR
jgi:hypothetical protein